MANEEHLEILKSGVDTWNAWRRENKLVTPELNEADLNRANLRGADLNRANLFRADLGAANLFGASLIDANLIGANLSRVTFNGAILIGANLSRAKFNGAKFRKANLRMADLNGADLNGADLNGAILRETVFIDVDLSSTKGLEKCTHRGPSNPDYRTIAKSKNVPLSFWRGCGLPDALIEYMPSLIGDAIQFYSCFISYSSKDQEFADRLHADLQNAGVRCWFAPHDMRTGDRIRDTIDEQIRVHEKLLLILSESSVSSGWVENEVEAAMEKEEGHKTVLFPVRIDDAVEGDSRAWARTIKRTRHITDFSKWKDHDSYKKSFDRILRDLKPENGDEG